MLTISNVFWTVFGAMWKPFAGLPQLGLFLFSLVTAALALIVWKYASNQRGITRAKDLIKANFFAMVLFGDSLTVLLASIAKTFGWIFVYLGRQMVPLIVMMIPILPMLVQIDHLYSFSPIVADPAGQDAAAQVEVVAVIDPKLNLFDLPATLTASGGVKPATKAVRIPFPQHPKSDWDAAPLIGPMLRNKRLDMDPPPPEVRWRIDGDQPGAHELTVTVGEHHATKSIVVADLETKDRLFQAARKRHAGGFGESFEFPGEPALTGAIHSIEVVYPRRDGWWWWVVIYLIETLVIALALKKPFKVDF